MQIKDAIEEWLDELDIEKASKETIRAYKNNLILFDRYINNKKEVEKITCEDIKKYIKTNKDRGLKTKTINSYIAALRKFFNYCIEESIYTRENPAFSVKQIKATDTKVIEVFSAEEMKALINYNKKSTDFLEFRNNLIVSFLLETGVRNHELYNLKDSDIFDQYALLKVTKNSKPRVVPISKELKKKMRKYERIRKNYFDKLKKLDKIDDYYFLSRSGKQLHRTNIGQIVHKVCDELGIDSKKAYPHNFRHTNAVTMLKNTGDIYTVSKLLGHQQVGITEIYLQGIKDNDILSMVDGKTILHNL